MTVHSEPANVEGGSEKALLFDAGERVHCTRLSANRRRNEHLVLKAVRSKVECTRPEFHWRYRTGCQAFVQVLPHPSCRPYQSRARAVETLIKSEHMKALRAPSVNSCDDSAVLPQTTSHPQGEHQSELLQSTSVAHGKVFDLVRTSEESSWTGSDAKGNSAANQDPAAAICRAGAAMAPVASRSYPGSQSDTGSDNACIRKGVATEALDPLPTSAGLDEYHDDYPESEDDEVAAADWLEVTHAMLDAGHASYIDR